MTCSTNYVETYRESTEHHASDDDDLGQVLVSPLTDGHGDVIKDSHCVNIYDTSPFWCVLCLLSESFNITSVSGSQ